MLAKIVVGVVLAGAVLGALAVGALGVTILAGLIGVLAVDELYKIQRTKGLRPLPFVGFAAVIAFAVVAHARGERAVPIFPAVVAGAFVLVAGTLVVQRRIEDATASVASSMLGVVYVGLLFAYVVVLRRMAFGTRLVLGLVLMTAINDVGSYALGAWRGKRALAPSVSPGKTWEGLLGGTLATMIAAVSLAALSDPPFDRGRALILGAVVAMAAPLGDLVESMLKRDADAKDAGRLLPGHGGVLDRIDSVLLAAPLFFYAYRALAR